MAKDKEKSVNPATASLKASKASAIKKQKAAIAAQRAQRLATRNPTHLANQIRTLKEEQEAKGRLPPQQQKRLEALEKELQGVKKAKEKYGTEIKDEMRGGARGEKRKSEAGHHGRDRRQGNANMISLGRDRGHRWGDRDESASEDTDPEVRTIPMPRDTPPPVPPRPRRITSSHAPKSFDPSQPPSVRPSDEPLPPLAQSGHAPQPHALPNKPPIASKNTQSAPRAVYESKPALRDLRKEATKAFVPAAVARRRAEAEKERERLKEPEELESDEGSEARNRAGGELDVEQNKDEEMDRFLGEVDMAQPSGMGEQLRHEAQPQSNLSDISNLADMQNDANEVSDRVIGSTSSREAPKPMKKMALVEDYDSDDN